MTGFQPSVTTNGRSSKAGASSVARSPDDEADGHAIESAVRGLGVRDVYSVDPFDEEATLAALRQAKSGAGVNVVICHSPCLVYERRVTKGKRRVPFAINQELCNGCSLCVRVLGCPALVVAGGVYTIEQDLCDGCELCARVCQHDAIHPVSVERT
jgi:indolepyruvate ferredoxin oxidoreductase alpha subunit